MRRIPVPVAKRRLKIVVCSAALIPVTASAIPGRLARDSTVSAYRTILSDSPTLKVLGQVVDTADLAENRQPNGYQTVVILLAMETQQIVQDV